MLISLFFQRCALKTHYAVAHGVDVEETLKYRCKFCPKRYNAPHKLKAHLLHQHFPDRRQFVCKFCPKAFSVKERLSRHLDRHTKQFLCPQCPKTFKGRNNVEQHLRQCHYPPSYECLDCGQMFHHRGMIRNHLKQIHQKLDCESHMKCHPIDMKKDRMNIRHITLISEEPAWCVCEDVLQQLCQLYFFHSMTALDSDISYSILRLFRLLMLIQNHVVEYVSCFSRQVHLSRNENKILAFSNNKMTKTGSFDKRLV